MMEGKGRVAEGVEREEKVMEGERVGEGMVEEGGVGEVTAVEGKGEKEMEEEG